MFAYPVSRRDFLAGLSASAALAALNSGRLAWGAEPASRPNVILIITDDQGYGDLGFTGNPVIETPNIDALARHSASMTNFYVHPVCAPTRACLMTGRYNYRTRVVDTYMGRAMMEPQETTLAEILRDAGYRTGIFGKWHLGDNYPMRPMDQGFDESLVIRGGGIGQPSDPVGGEGKYTDPMLVDNGKVRSFKGYCTDIYFDRAIAWLERCQQEKKPFFAYIPTNAPHGPFHDVPEELYQHYKSMNLASDQFPQEKGHKLPDKVNQDTLARIFAMVTNIDQNVGRLMAKLKQMNLTENTMVMFMVDNGPNTNRYVAGMKGWKSFVHEGGIHAPFFMHWPETLKAGHQSDRIAAHIDILPTVAEACQVQLPETLNLDGRSILPLLKGQAVDWPDRMIVIQSHRGDVPVKYHHFAARTQRWKLLNASGFGKEKPDGPPQFELYDMIADPLEEHNLAAEKPEIVEPLKQRYEAWFEDVSSTRPDNYDPPRIYIGTEHENPVVLTREDWRHVSGRPWAPDSNGFWLLDARKEALYDIKLLFPSLPQPARLSLDLSGNILTGSAQKGQTEYTFKAVPVVTGNLKLQADIELSGQVQGPHQVYVTCR